MLLLAATRGCSLALGICSHESYYCRWAHLNGRQDMARLNQMLRSQRIVMDASTKKGGTRRNVDSGAFAYGFGYAFDA